MFLDEIGDMPLDMQVKVTARIAGKKQDIGSNQLLDIDVRIIAATHRKSPHIRFRQDPFRLNVLPLVAAPLRERQPDAELVETFRHPFSNSRAKSPLRLSETVGYFLS